MILKNQKIKIENHNILVYNASGEIDKETGLALLPDHVLAKHPGVDAQLGGILFQEFQKKNPGQTIDFYPNGKLFFGFRVATKYRDKPNVGFFQNRVHHNSLPDEAIIIRSLSYLATFYFVNSFVKIGMEHPGSDSTFIEPAYQHISDSVTLYLGRD